MPESSSSSSSSSVACAAAGRWGPRCWAAPRACGRRGRGSDRTVCWRSRRPAVFVAATARLWRGRLTSRGSSWPGRLCAGPGAAARWLFSPRPAFWFKRKMVILKMWKSVSVSCWEGIMRRAGRGWLTLLFLSVLFSCLEGQTCGFGGKASENVIRLCRALHWPPNRHCST